MAQTVEQLPPGDAAEADPGTSPAAPAKRRTRATAGSRKKNSATPATSATAPAPAAAAPAAPARAALPASATTAPQTPPGDLSRRLGDRHLLDSDALENIDRMTNIALGQMSGGISPASLAMAYLDWTVHLASSPGKQFQLGAKALRKAMRLGAYALSSAVTGNAEPCIKPLPVTTASITRAGSAIPTTSSRRVSCSTSSGGTTRPPASAASPNMPRRRSGSPPSRFST
jgi:hypothetical protein